MKFVEEVMSQKVKPLSLSLSLSFSNKSQKCSRFSTDILINAESTIFKSMHNLLLCGLNVT